MFLESRRQSYVWGRFWCARCQFYAQIAILWLILSHRGYPMAPRLQKHEYLLVTKFWSEFEHFRMSGSIITWELFLSLTRCFKGCSFFHWYIDRLKPCWQIQRSSLVARSLLISLSMPWRTQPTSSATSKPLRRLRIGTILLHQLSPTIGSSRQSSNCPGC